MATTLTDDFADKAQGPPADGKRAYVIHYDAKVRGFGLRVTKASAKSFVLNYRVDGVERRYTIGTFRDPWRTIAARTEASRLKKLIDQGIDPQGERNTIRAAPNVNDLVARYLSDHAPRKRARSVKEDEKLFRQWIRPELGTYRVGDIRAADVEALHRKITRHGTPYRANRCLALLSKLFSLAVRWEWRPDNPARGIERNPEHPRHRYLTPEELASVLSVLSGHPNQQVANAIRLLLLTGARSGELFASQWKQFDLQAGTWVKPASYVKTGREHRIPLSAPARQLLANMWAEVAQAAKHENGEPPLWLFPGDNPSGNLMTIHRDWQKILKAAGVSDARVHDLRHTYASYLASAGLSLPIIGKLLGHTQAATTLRYSHLLDDPLRVATERVGRIVVAASGETKRRNVVKLTRRARARQRGAHDA